MIRLMSLSMLTLMGVLATATGGPGSHDAERPAGAAPARAAFTVRIENVSTGETLRLSSGETAPAPTAPVLWVLHASDAPIFVEGEPDRGQGLESLAEDGNPASLAGSLRDAPGIEAVGFVNVPQGASEPGPILPGNAFEFEVDAAPGQRLTVAFMFGQSNDLFFAPTQEGIALFDGSGAPIAGDRTGELLLWDAGTEVNQEPGLGPDQAPRQSGDDVGAAEGGTVRPITDVRDGFTYPAVDRVVRLTVRTRSVSE